MSPALLLQVRKDLEAAQKMAQELAQQRVALTAKLEACKVDKSSSVSAVLLLLPDAV